MRHKSSWCSRRGLSLLSITKTSIRGPKNKSYEPQLKKGGSEPRELTTRISKPSGRWQSAIGLRLEGIFLLVARSWALLSRDISSHNKRWLLNCLFRRMCLGNCRARVYLREPCKFGATVELLETGGSEYGKGARARGCMSALLLLQQIPTNLVA